MTASNDKLLMLHSIVTLKNHGLKSLINQRLAGTKEEEDT